jgi:uncharacterized protein
VYYSSNYLLYLLISLPALLLGFWAQSKIRSAYAKYSQVRTATGLTGAEVARLMLDRNGLRNIQIEQVAGSLSDHYDPSSKTLRLSQGVYSSPSVAAAGVAAHETGHAIQDATNYGPLKIRSLMVPTVKIGSWIGPIVFMVGLALSSTNVAWIGIFLFSATALFSLLTLPVEINASSRAKEWLANSGVIYSSEIDGVHKVLDAAALTYVAGALQSISTIFYYVFLLLGRSRRN